MLAKPSAKFKRPCIHVTLAHKPYERRSVAIVPMSEAAQMNPREEPTLRNEGRGYSYWTRSRVVEAVRRGEMRWLDRFHNMATFTTAAGGTWQKTQSGPVATMQMRVGAKGRYVPVAQREPELNLGLAYA